MEPSAIELICPASTREEIAESYWEMYQLQRSPAKLPCDGETEELLHQEIIDSIKECLWNKWVPTQQGEDVRQCPACAPRLTIVPGTMLPMTDSRIGCKTPVKRL